MAKKKKVLPINYTNRDFTSIRKDLIDIAKRYYPDSYKDFTEASFGSLMIDAVSYIGDQLSFYLDYQANESFLDTSIEYNNILRHGRIMGYKTPGRPSTYGTVSLFVLVPAASSGFGPDSSYIPVLRRGTVFSSKTNSSFTLTDNVDFADSKVEIVVARVNETTGAPTFYALKTTGRVVSGFQTRTQIDVGDYQKYRRIKLDANNVSEILEVFDDQGNEYFEVDYLSDDVIYKEVVNPNFKNDQVPSVLKPFSVPRRFVVERERDGVYLRFGTGKETMENEFVDPAEIVLDQFGKNYVSSTTFDPSRLVSNSSLGIVPSNTRLSISYRINTPTNSNAAVGSVNSVASAQFEFENASALSANTMRDVTNSIEVYNEEQIVGDVTNPTSDEIKNRILDTYATQNRAVTKLDYEALVYKMPSKFGALKRCSVVRDQRSLKRNLNLYVIAEDTDLNFTEANATLKQNLKQWLGQFRMINDTIDILDAKVINLGISFEVEASADKNKFDILNLCMETLQEFYSRNKYFIGEPFYISEVYSILNKLDGVNDVIDVSANVKSGTSYAATVFSVKENLSPDGNYIMAPKNGVFEIKFPELDIKGSVK